MLVERFGPTPYAPMLKLQQLRHAAVADGLAPETLFLLEHTPVLTLGKNTGDGHVLASREELVGEGVELYRTSRGGDVTYHGPGQITGYPILALGERERDIKKYVFRLEEILIRTVADYGVKAERIEGLRGIWVQRQGRMAAKIGAIGVRIARWTTMHGFALNVTPNLEHFGLIVACGIRDKGVTSLAELVETPPSVAEVMDRIVHHASEVLERPAEEVAASPLPTLMPGEIVEELPPAHDELERRKGRDGSQQKVANS